MDKQIILSKIIKTAKTEPSYAEKGFEKPSTMTNEEAIQRSDKIQQFYQNEYEDFMEAKLEYWANKDNPDYEPPEKYAQYLEQIKNVDPRDIIYDGKLVRLSLDEAELHIGLAETHDIELNESAQRGRVWNYQFSIETSQNRYENAPEFEAFVNKWIDKGLSEEEALYRAEAYASLGLLDYGNQRAIRISGLPYGDKKEHGFHQIDNEPLKQAVLETLDSLSTEDVQALKSNVFGNGVINTSLNFDRIPGLSFQDYLNNFATLQEKADPLKEEYEDFTFDGNINLTQDMDQTYQNFIVDNIKAYFEHRIQDLNSNKDEDLDHEYLEKQRGFIQVLIDNFDKNIKEQKDDLES